MSSGPRRPRRFLTQNLHERRGKSYEAWQDGKPIWQPERPQANPDVLPEGSGLWQDAAPKSAQLRAIYAVFNDPKFHEALDEREKQICSLCIVGNFPEWEAAKRLKLSRQRVNQIKAEVVGKIREAAKKALQQIESDPYEE